MIHLEQVLENGYPSHLNISYWDTNGKKRLKKLLINKSELYEWEECYKNDPYADKKFKSAYGNPVKKIPLKKYKKLSKFRIYELMNRLPDDLKKTFYSLNQPNKTFFDIETESTGTFPDASNPKHAVLTNVFVTNNVVEIYGLKQLNFDDIKSIEKKINNHIKKINDKSLIKDDYVVEYTMFDSEEKLMSAMNVKRKRDIDMLFGWNSFKFDDQYLSNRGITMYGFDLDNVEMYDRNYKFMHKASPTNNHFVLRIADKFAKNGDKINVPVPYHSPTLDYMEIYEKFDRSLQTSLSLDSVSENLLGLKKIQYSSTLDELYNRDYKTFLFYNAIDTILVQLIDRKTKTFDTPLALSSFVGVPIHDSLFAGIMCEKLFCDWYYENNQVFINTFNNEKSSYEGGFVLEPLKKGMVHDVMIYDFTSMFPSGMMAFNYGMDTKLGKTHNNQTYICDKTKQEIDIDKNIHIVSPNGIIYSKNEGDSSLRKMVFSLFNGRVQRKIWSKEIDAELNSIKHGDKINDPKHIDLDNFNKNRADEISRLESLSIAYGNEAQAMKIIMNSIYGVLGWSGFPLFNLDVASSVTSQSRDLIKYTISEFNSYFKEKWYNDKEVHEKMGITVTQEPSEDVIIYADTDSVFLHMENIINHTKEWEDFKSNIDKVYYEKMSEADKDQKVALSKEKINEISSWRREFCLNIHKHVLDNFTFESMRRYCDKWGAFRQKPDGEESFGLGLEQINASIFFIKKKKYIKNTVWSEGSMYDPLEKINPKGVEMNQASKPKFVRESLKKITMRILEQTSDFNMKHIISEMKDIKEMFNKCDIEDICNVERVNDVYSSIASDNPLTFISGATMNSKAAGYYNNWIKTRKDCEKYKLISNGDKIGIYYTTEEDKHKKVFGFPINEGIPHVHPQMDRKKQFEKLILTPVNNMLKLIDKANTLKYDLNDIKGALF